MRILKLALLVSLSFYNWSGAQQHKKMLLQNLDEFTSDNGNWKVIGEITVDPDVDILSFIKAQAEPLTRKEIRKRRRNDYVEPKPIKTKTGTGILYNDFGMENNKNLISTWEHGDIKLKMDIMIPKGSNSGIYLQGRYEIQLYDSWGIQTPKFSDLGGIYRNWLEEPDKRFPGIAPLSNASKAPGLWQTLFLHFEAPRFDNSGIKIKNARLVSVELNGVQIHSNIEIPFVTGGAISTEEAETGPLMIQGDHGPVAFRNMEYTLLSDLQLQLTDIEYNKYLGEFKYLEDLVTATPTEKGELQAIDINAIGEEDNYGVIFKGKLKVPNSDEYIFNVGYTGGVELKIGNKSILKNNSAEHEGVEVDTVSLAKGEHTFQLINIKSAGWRQPKLGCTVRTIASNLKHLHTADSYAPQASGVSPIYVGKDVRPQLLRGFVNFEGDGKRLTHTIGIGMPSGLNFVYNLDGGGLIGVWRGDFVDATPMWHNRGNGSFIPKGNVQWTYLDQPLTELSDMNMEFPSKATSDFKSHGYRIDPENGYPTFIYDFKGVGVENKIIPSNDHKSLINQLNFSGQVGQNWYYKLGEGDIVSLDPLRYAIDGFQYFVVLNENMPKPVIREINGTSELLLPIHSNEIEYKIVW